MIKSFRHKGLERFFYTGNTSGIRADHARRLQLILSRLDASTSAQDMNLPGLRLHSLKGKYRHYWAVSVSGNWRVIFKFDGSDAELVDYLDYH